MFHPRVHGPSLDQTELKLYFTSGNERRSTAGHQEMDQHVYWKPFGRRSVSVYSVTEDVKLVLVASLVREGFFFFLST